jgi:SAM-dependent methyltransferase
MTPTCRLCGAALERIVIDLGMSPLSNGFVSPADDFAPEVFYPLRALVCDDCHLMQLPALARRESVFGDNYAYFSSYSTTWLEHCQQYARDMVARFQLGPDDLVMEIASNDGYLLQYFQACGIQVLGVEPSANVANVAQRERNIPTEVCFFGVESAARLRAQGFLAALVCANNVLAHVPDLRDFLAGIPEVLAARGVVTFEFPHLLRLLEDAQFDTIYQEHYSYLSFHTVQRALIAHELRVFDVEQIETHGGSLRVFACHAKDPRPTGASVSTLLGVERDAGLYDVASYATLGQRAQRIKRDFLRFLIDAKESRKVVLAYGAPAKGNTLLNYCGVRADLLELTVDRNPNKQGMLLPGTHIPVLSPLILAERRPDYVVVLPWNLRKELTAQLRHVRDWGGKLVTVIPRLDIFSP